MYYWNAQPFNVLYVNKKIKKIEMKFGNSLKSVFIISFYYLQWNEMLLPIFNLSNNLRRITGFIWRDLGILVDQSHQDSLKSYYPNFTKNHANFDIS